VSRALIVGDQTDTHVIAVLEAITALGGSSPLVLDAPRLTMDPYLLSSDSLTVGDDTIALADRAPGWLRRYAPTRWGAGTVAGTLEAVSKRAFLTLVGSISRLGNRAWLTDLDTMLRAEDRLLQLTVATELAMRIPRTVVTSDGDRARSVLGDRFVVKPISSGSTTRPKARRPCSPPCSQRMISNESSSPTPPLLHKNRSRFASICAS
jgi:hypothetical protein